MDSQSETDEEYNSRFVFEESDDESDDEYIYVPIATKTCPTCKKNKPMDQFIKNNKELTRCKNCRYECEHGKLRNHCRECGGSSICKHGRIRSTCKECGGASICEHGKQRSQCKECGGGSLCKSDWCESIKRPEEIYQGYCTRCAVHLIPDLPIPKNYRTKEFEVSKHVKDRFVDYDFTENKKITGGCSAKRPDLMVDLLTHVIIIEVDENGHRSYDCSCENKRTMEISQDIGHRPIVFIRFNPDSYVDIDGIKVKSCWKTSDKTGKLQISNKKDWKKRIDLLLETIDYWINNNPEKTIEVVQLFYSCE